MTSPSTHSPHTTGGFTMIELLLSVSIIGLLSAVILPFSTTLLIRNDLHTAIQTSADALYRAQTLARSGADDSQWGVLVQQGSVTLFEGSSYASRVVASDETTSLPATIRPTNMTEIVFSKLFGHPTQSGILTLTSEHNESRILTINEVGTISY